MWGVVPRRLCTTVIFVSLTVSESMRFIAYNRYYQCNRQTLSNTLPFLRIFSIFPADGGIMQIFPACVKSNFGALEDRVLRMLQAVFCQEGYPYDTTEKGIRARWFEALVLLRAQASSVAEQQPATIVRALRCCPCYRCGLLSPSEKFLTIPDTASDTIT